MDRQFIEVVREIETRLFELGWKGDLNMDVIEMLWMAGMKVENIVGYILEF